MSVACKSAEEIMRILISITKPFVPPSDLTISLTEPFQN